LRQISIAATGESDRRLIAGDDWRWRNGAVVQHEIGGTIVVENDDAAVGKDQQFTGAYINGIYTTIGSLHGKVERANRITRWLWERSATDV